VGCCHSVKLRFEWFFFLIRIVGGRVQAGSTRHVGHWMAYFTCPGWLWWWRIWWNENWQGKPKYSEKTCPSATLSTTNPTWPDPGCGGGQPATNRLSYGATLSDIYNYVEVTQLRCRPCNTLESYHELVPWAWLMIVFKYISLCYIFKDDSYLQFRKFSWACFFRIAFKLL
jgi:hypothetical protein